MRASSSNFRWAILALTVVNQAAVIGIASYSFTLFSVAWQEAYNTDRGQLMLPIFILLLMSSLSAPFMGKRLDNMSLRMPVIFGLVAHSLGLWFLSMTTAYWQVVTVYALFFPFALLLCGGLVSQLLINRWFTTGKGLALGISATGTSIGGMLFPLLVANAMASYSVPTILVFLGVSCAAVLIPLNVILLKYKPPSEKLEVSKHQQESADRNYTTRSIVMSPSFWIPVLAIVPALTAFSSIQHNLGTYIDGMGHPLALAGQLLAITSFMMIIGKVLYGKLADRFDHRYLLVFISVVQIITLVLLVGSPTKATLFVAAVLWGVSSGGLMPLMAMTLASRFPASIFGKVMGLNLFFMMIPSFGPFYTGLMYDAFGSYDFAFLSLIALIVPGIVAVKWLPQPRNRP